MLNDIEAYEESVPWTKKIPLRAVKFEAGEENRIVYESLFCYSANSMDFVDSTDFN